MGENYGNPDCGVPVSDRFEFKPTRQPVVMDFWEPFAATVRPTRFTTIGNWQQPWRSVTFQRRGLSLEQAPRVPEVPRPAATLPSQRFELALSSFDDEDRQCSSEHGWRVRHAMDVQLRSRRLPRSTSAESRGEFTVAKDQNVRLRSGWFSDRSATYLAGGRPVITQETGFSNVLPTGEGLFGFSTMDEIEAAIGRINADYARHSQAARAIAREWFDYRVVLGGMLDHLGASAAPGGDRMTMPRTVSADLVLTPVSRWPTTLPDDSIRAILDTPVAERVPGGGGRSPARQHRRWSPMKDWSSHGSAWRAFWPQKRRLTSR